jgi:DNA-binding CsgD family transcriptional regulator/PAS domain-containing protein
LTSKSDINIFDYNSLGKNGLCDILEAVPTPLLIHCNGIIKFANNETMKLLHAKHDHEVIGKSVLSFVHPDSLKDVLARMKEYGPDNPTAPLLIEKFFTVDKIVLEGKISGILLQRLESNTVLISLQDITEENKVSLQLKKLLDRSGIYKEFIDDITEVSEFGLGNFTSFSKKIVEFVAEEMQVSRAGIWICKKGGWESIDSFTKRTKLFRKGVVIKQDLPLDLAVNQIVSIQNKKNELNQIDYFRNFNTESCLIIPFGHGKKIHGMIMLEEFNLLREWTMEEMHLLGMINDLINSHLYYVKTNLDQEKLKSLSQTVTDIILTVDVNGEIKYLNRVLSTSSHVKDFLNRNIYDFFENDQVKNTIREKMNKGFEELTPQSFDLLIDYSDELKWVKVHIGHVATVRKKQLATIVVKNITKEKASIESAYESKVALKILMNHFNEEKNAYKNQILKKVEDNIFPLLNEIKNSGSSFKKPVEHIEYLISNILSTELESGDRLTELLTITEKKICNYIRQGFLGKEIANVLNLSFSTVETHKKNIRKKLKLTNSKISLKNYLSSLGTGQGK